MNSKIFVGIAVGVFAIMIGVFTLSGPSLINDISDGGIFSPSESITVLPVKIQLDDISISEVNSRATTIDIAFELTNPNYKSVILQFVKYELYEGDTRIHVGEIGERPQGMLQFSSNYYTLLTDTPIILSDIITIKNSGNIPQLWDAFTNNSADFKVKGQAFFNLSSITAGGENEVTFEFDYDL